MVVRIGDVVVPSGTNVWPHELATAKALAMAGHDVEFLPRIDGKEVKSADVLMDGVVWEMKSPTSSSVKSLQKVLRRAGKQSHNVIVDTARMRAYRTERSSASSHVFCLSSPPCSDFAS